MAKKKKKSLPKRRSHYNGSIKLRRLHTIDLYDPQSKAWPQKQVDYTMPMTNIIAVSDQAVRDLQLDVNEYLKQGGKVIIINNIIQNNHNCQQFFAPLTDCLFIHPNMKKNENN